MDDTGQHSERVDAWLTAAAKELSPEELLQLFEAAFDALWTRTATTLGEVTLTAISERVLHAASEQYPLLSAIKLHGHGKVDLNEVRERLAFVQRAELLEALRSVLVEFLTVLGNLTAEVLSAELHAHLAAVTLNKPARPGPGPRRTHNHPRDDEDDRS